MPKDAHYTRVIRELNADKDSIIEFAKVIEYDPERMVVRLYTMTSRQYLDDVLLLFPSMYQNTGIISPPAINSTGILIWGAERQPYLLPVQYTIPKVTIEESRRIMNASPGMINELLTLKNVQPGEHLIRSLAGSYVYAKNTGDVEMGTPQLYRLSLSAKDGSLSSAIERVHMNVGGNLFYFGPVSPQDNTDTRTRQFMRMYEHTDESQFLPEEVDDNSLLENALNGNILSVELEEKEPIFVTQKGHVFTNEEDIVFDEIDDTELFQEDIMQKDGAYMIERLSKGGRKSYRFGSDGNVTEVSFSPSRVDITQMNGTEAVNLSVANGQVLIRQGEEEYDLLPMLKWFYEQRSGEA